jgi:hypothetical protein
MYNTGFRDKGSPYHGGGGDIAASLPRKDEPLLGTFDRVFASTGNATLGHRYPKPARVLAREQLGIPYLHANYMRLYFNFNGSLSAR